MNTIRKLLTRLTAPKETHVIVESIYPIQLARGNYQTTTQGDTTEWHDITPIINHDGTITAYRDGYFIGYIIDYDNIGMR